MHAFVRSIRFVPQLLRRTIKNSRPRYVRRVTWWPDRYLGRLLLVARAVTDFEMRTRRWPVSHRRVRLRVWDQQRHVGDGTRERQNVIVVEITLTKSLTFLFLPQDQFQSGTRDKSTLQLIFNLSNIEIKSMKLILTSRGSTVVRVFIK